MPFQETHDEDDRILGLWKIQETEQALLSYIPGEQIPEYLIHPQKRLEWVAGRVLTFKLLSRWKYDYQGITKDRYGKPYPTGHRLELSLSHSYPFVAAIVCTSEPVGIDVEQPKEKLLRIAPRILAPHELENAGRDVVKHCVYWCAKETLIKIHGKKDLSFATSLNVDPFALADEGEIVGRIIAADNQIAIPLQYRASSSMVLVYNKKLHDAN